MAALQCEICGGKLIGKPGGLFECEFCGTEYSTEWARTKIQEIKGTVQVEGTVEVTGSVKVDGAVEVKGSVSKESLLRRGQLALEDKDWETAKDCYEKTLDAAPESAEAYFGLAMCEAEVNSLKDLVNTIEWENKNYLKGKRFASGALLAQVEQLEQVNIQLFKEKDRRLKPIREQVRKAAYLMEASFHIVGVKADGTVVAVGWNSYGQCEVGSWRDIVAVSAGASYTVGVKADGTVVAVGENGDDWREVGGWQEIVQVSANERHTVGLKADGTVVAVGRNSYGQCEVGSWRDIVQVNAGCRHTAGVKADGTVVAVGNNGDGRCDVSTWRLFQQLDTLEQERIDGRIAREKQDEEERIAWEKQEEEARIAAGRWEAGLCQHCGGQLKGLFSKKCVVCGKPKDY